MLFKDKVALITGSTSGLGEAIAKKLAKEGARGILVTGRNPEQGARVVADLEALGTKAVFFQAELSDAAACRALAAQLDEHFDGHIHGLVNSAADTRRGTIEDTTSEFWDHQFAVNLRAPFILTQEAVRRMQKQKLEGSIINIGSTSGYCGQSFLTSYATTKGALITFTKNVANSQRHHRIRCNAILPGWMDTPWEHWIQKEFHDADDSWLEKAGKQRPFGRLIDPDKVANLAALILSNSSGVMTGAIIDFDQILVEDVE